MTNLFEFIVGLINICLLAFLLWKLFGKTVRESLAEREREIKAKVEEAEAIYTEAKSELEKYQTLVSNIDSKKAEMIERAKRNAKELKETTAAKAQREAADIVSKVKHEMDDAHRIAKAELRTQIAKATVLQAKAILADAIDEEVHQNILEKFLSEVGGMRC
ncbi:ATP synthase F0 subunit B [bacterium]|nr:ATP synthase F0 subunit B [bacterium]